MRSLRQSTTLVAGLRTSSRVHGLPPNLARHVIFQSQSIRHNSSLRPDPSQKPLNVESNKPEDESIKGVHLYTTTLSAQADLLGKVSKAWSTPTKWYPIPIALGALVLLAVQWRKQSKEDVLEVESQREGAVVRSRKVDGPWQVSPFSIYTLRVV